MKISPFPALSNMSWQVPACRLAPKGVCGELGACRKGRSGSELESGFKGVALLFHHCIVIVIVSCLLSTLFFVDVLWSYKFLSSKELGAFSCDLLNPLLRTPPRRTADPPRNVQVGSRLGRRRE